MFENRAPFAKAVEAARERNRNAGVEAGENKNARSYIKGASEIFFDLLAQGTSKDKKQEIKNEDNEI
ncbi:hypothetical protein [Pontiella desulfatans]|uniref:hypothetical protein n=1 Tax=Pontiella desulfatans TaxID=2750659 RepID=UPI00109D14BA|nr:hypothetical protein [Pontiella desulfatans]